MANTSFGSLGSLSEVLAICAVAWASRFDRALMVDWDDSVDQLSEELDRLALDCHAAGEHSLSGAAVDLAAYLSSFVGSNVRPNEKQRTRLKEMCALVGAAAYGVQYPPGSCADAAAAAQPSVPERASGVTLLRASARGADDCMRAAIASVALSEQGLRPRAFAE